MARKPAQSGDAPAADETDKDKPAASNRTRNIVTGAAIGIGSAALVAALLYANRSRKTGKRN